MHRNLSAQCGSRMPPTGQVAAELPEGGQQQPGFVFASLLGPSWPLTPGPTKSQAKRSLKIVKQAVRSYRETETCMTKDVRTTCGRTSQMRSAAEGSYNPTTVRTLKRRN
ncbi:unnamed protein product [Prorocentrum cordatum]|uniref:Uncharacterized protein n=1 Tax=Prorocentrum cordatum TaxID=2364126 RepID=A0ABN9VYY0_9DINO|nr:unnamed protein product [Polarella glacialis]